MQGVDQNATILNSYSTIALRRRWRQFEIVLAEREGFEPSVMLPPRLISSQVHSTTLPPLLHSPLRLVTAANSISSVNSKFTHATR